MDSNGKTLDIDANELKSHIANRNISVVNLKLTSDGRLIDNKNISDDRNSKAKALWILYERSVLAVDGHQARSLREEVISNAYKEIEKAMGIDLDNIDLEEICKDKDKSAKFMVEAIKYQMNDIATYINNVFNPDNGFIDSNDPSESYLDFSYTSEENKHLKQAIDYLYNNRVNNLNIDFIKHIVEMCNT